MQMRNNYIKRKQYKNDNNKKERVINYKFFN